MPHHTTEMRQLILAFNRIDNVYYQFARNSSIGENKLILLYALNDGQGHSQKEISKNWLLPRTTVNSIIKDLERDELITQAAIPGKRREKKIWLTDKGIAYANEALKVMYQCESGALDAVLQVYPSFVNSMKCFSRELEQRLKDMP